MKHYMRRIISVLCLILITPGCSESSSKELYKEIAKLGYNPYSPPRSGYGVSSIVYFKNNLVNDSQDMELVCSDPFVDLTISMDDIQIEQTQRFITQSVGQNIELSKAVKLVKGSQHGEQSSQRQITIAINKLKSRYFAWEEMADDSGDVKQFSPQCNFAINDYLNLSDVYNSQRADVKLYILTDVAFSNDVTITTKQVENLGIDVNLNRRDLGAAGFRVSNSINSESTLAFNTEYNLGFKAREIKSLLKHGGTSTPRVTVKL